MERGTEVGLGLPISEFDQKSGQIHKNQKSVVGILFLTARSRLLQLFDHHFVPQR